MPRDLVSARHCISRLGPPMLLFATGFAIRMYYADTLYLHFDEAIQLNAASARQWLAYHHPPLLLWWVWFASKWAEQTWWLRFAPCLAGSLTPVLLALWLQQKSEKIVAWTLGSLLALSPNIVLLTIQLRGYTFAMLAAVVAVWTAQIAFNRHSNRAMVLHWCAITVGLLAELSFVFVLFATVLYGAFHVWDHRCPAVLRRWWVIGLAVSCGLCIWLLFALVRPMMELPREVTAYLEPLLYDHRQSLFRFLFGTVYAQFVYLFGIECGLFGLALFVIGCVRMALSRDRSLILAVGPFVAIGFSYLRLYPMGASRHTAVVGIAALLAVVVGIEWLGRRHWSARYTIALLLVCGALYSPRRDTMDFPLESWQQQDWSRAIETLSREIPPGDLLVVDDYLSEMLLAKFQSPAARSSLNFRRRPTEIITIGPWQALRVGSSLSAAELSQQISKLPPQGGSAQSRKAIVWVVSGFWNPMLTEKVSIMFRNSVMVIGKYVGQPSKTLGQ